jgi:uncharacterized coiled-coil DUF342 family protein
MDLIKTVGIIRKDLDEVSALLDQLYETPGPHIAEIELARSRVRSATEMLKLLPRLSEVSPPQPANVPQEASVVQPAAEVKQKAAVTTAVEKKPEKLKKEPAEVKAEAVKTEPETSGKEPEAARKEPETAKTILADKFSAADTIGEKATAVRQDEIITSALHSKPISDIGAAIGINDKFYFIRELFSGDTRAYQDTIKRLNTSASLGEAMKILDESTVMGSDPVAQSSFVDVVRRKFNINV